MSAAASNPRTGQIQAQIDLSRRPDVLLRRRTPEGHQVSGWWMVGAFAGVSLAVVGLMNFFPGA
ncbi:UDP-N-acetylmuramyl pentapeptide phosphotransferase [Microbacterium flavum]|uniref:UDP-N-acetylmuramyl pentapeptide phosphotransferase n=1 Tax=Microbacterium flavum TaxID=415216 RepID=A0ABS5XRW5_9MICO|nr:UDP-N-acetylmuramyl pentapeptide phosphotransferase [Microbacterium flavum]MBT8797276.1 UDP-N-acetylmuramyl pentapeptide phosphotransferase [Microbacterium flavum]